MRGWILRRSWRPAEAVESLEVALGLNPHSVEALERLVETHGILGDVQSVQRMHERRMASPSVDVDSRGRYATVRLGVLGAVDAFRSSTPIASTRR